MRHEGDSDANSSWCTWSSLQRLVKILEKMEIRGKITNIQTTVCWRLAWIVLWTRKASLMKTQTRILDNRLYYTRKIELHRKSKKSRTVRITPILICGIWCSPHLTGKCGTKTFLGGPVDIPLIRGAHNK